MKQLLVINAIAAVVLLSIHQVSAYSMYAMRVPNGANVPGVTALGHVDPVLAGPMNEFGMDMIDADFKWTRELCMKDSDGDGQTNGQELGDPCCEFVFRKNAVVRWTEGVSHPGDAEFKSDPKLWADIVCETAAEPANASTAATEKTEAAAPAAVETKATTMTTTPTVVETGTVTEDKEGPVLVSSGKTEGATHEEAAENAAPPEEKRGATPALYSSTLLSAVMVVGLLGFVMLRRRRSQWTLLPQQQQRRTQ